MSLHQIRDANQRAKYRADPSIHTSPSGEQRIRTVPTAAERAARILADVDAEEIMLRGASERRRVQDVQLELDEVRRRRAFYDTQPDLPEGMAWPPVGVATNDIGWRQIWHGTKWFLAAMTFGLGVISWMAYSWWTSP